MNVTATDDDGFDDSIETHLVDLAEDCRRYAASLLRNNRVQGFDADDIVQEASLAALANRDNFHTPKALKAWLFTTIRRLVSRHCARTRLHDRYLCRAANNTSPLRDETIDLSLENDDVADGSLASSMETTGSWLKGHMPEHLYDCLMFYESSGLDIKTCAKNRGVSEGAFRGLLYRAREWLRGEHELMDYVTMYLIAPRAVLLHNDLLHRLRRADSRTSVTEYWRMLDVKYKFVFHKMDAIFALNADDDLRDRALHLLLLDCLLEEYTDAFLEVRPLGKDGIRALFNEECPGSLEVETSKLAVALTCIQSTTDDVRSLLDSVLYVSRQYTALIRIVLDRGIPAPTLNGALGRIEHDYLCATCLLLREYNSQQSAS